MRRRTGQSSVYYKRAKEGFERFLGENDAKTIEATYFLACRTHKGSKFIGEMRVLLKKAKKSLGKNRVTYEIANR